MRHLRKFNESNNIRTYDKLALTNEESIYNDCRGMDRESRKWRLGC